MSISTNYQSFDATASNAWVGKRGVPEGNEDLVRDTAAWIGYALIKQPFFISNEIKTDMENCLGTKTISELRTYVRLYGNDTQFNSSSKSHWNSLKISCPVTSSSCLALSKLIKNAPFIFINMTDDSSIPAVIEVKFGLQSSKLQAIIDNRWAAYQMEITATEINILYISQCFLSILQTVHQNAEDKIIKQRNQLLAQEERIKAERIRQTADHQRNEISQLKRYYASQSHFINASKEIFESNNRDLILRTLKSRAKQNPGGASAKTVEKFNLQS